MANDRIYIQCKTCKHFELLAKYYPSGSFVPEYRGAREKIDSLSDFIDTHIRNCRGLLLYNTLEDDCGFSLETEQTLKEPTTSSIKIS